MDITTPALLFSAISLLLNAYNGRYLSLSKRIREFHSGQQKKGERIEKKEEQIRLFRKRLDYIKRMQFFAVSALFLSTLSVFMLLLRMETGGQGIFALSLAGFLVSLYYVIRDILCSTEHLKVLEI